MSVINLQGRVTETSSACSFTLRMCTIAQWDSRPKPGAMDSIWLPKWVEGVQILDPSPAAFQV